jgi:hypothetical protein
LSELSSWAVEVIVDGDHLYRRLAPDTIRNGRVNRGAYYFRGQPDPFRGQPDPSVSVDLARMTTPERTRQGARHPDQVGVGELPAHVPLGLGLTVRHAPIDGNNAHCLIEGVTTRAVCQTLADHTTIIIAPAAAS